MELLAYIQEEFINADDSAIASEMPETFQVWFKKFTTNSAKLSLNVLLTGTTLLIGLGSTLNALAAEAPSSDVKYVQSLLAKNGFDPGAIDGVAGASTKNAILRAQKAFGLTPDGIVGSRTIAALEDGKSVDESATKVDVVDTKVNVSETTSSASSTVMNLQKLLADRGFYNGAVDGIMGSQTRSAIVAAQKAYNLTADGVAGPQTLAALESDGARAATTTISSTSTTTKSAEVSSLQELLSNRGFYNGAVDGIMGPQTRTAIVAAQKNYGLTTDGIAGAQTLAALDSGVSKVSVATKNTETIPSATKTSDKDVVALQQLLARRGFYNGAIDGVKGAQTNAAIATAQKNYGLTVDGIAGTQTIAALQTDAKPSVAAPKPTTSNQAANTVIPAIDGGVANLQNLLTDRGFYNGPITGFLGTRTRDAIVAAQKAYGLTADGVAGARTIAALEAGAPKQPIAATNVTPTIRVEPKPQVTPQPTPQPQAVVTPKPQPTVQATPKPTTTPAAQPTTAPAAQPTTAPVAQPTTPAATANTQVSELQRLLAQRGFYTGKVDGVLSGETRNAIIRAQNFYTIIPADGSPSNKLIDSLSKDTFISEGN
ncbi:N-acetylmuramoyl-L-alanine amidase [Pseudanabaena sp. lw0831]|uniref:peptidoglycan-binding domain-containing protein n=1 Tax=Pseudanabaena sp. lw0831 TaxID=1357935 RepID=UPI001A2D75A0|nr:peptidoglycan-binding protein [Pseudanabaena sp. lw0831]GBO53535.1 N-acetylmuramoyl-L-alanine amidase [Pseudanabaena sp. lw0831]